MKFHLAINLERMDENIKMPEVAQHTLEMVQIADKAGFEVVWAAEHHALEMTIAPNPFQLLTWWAMHTKSIRLGCGVANAAYWNPINLAGEAAMVDLLSEGRLELGLGSGAYQREFDRMKPGLMQPDSWRYMQEMMPVVRQLWQGDVEHKGEFWQFPKATSCPKPLQANVPMWVAARAPITFDYAVANNCNIMTWPLTKDMSEAQDYMQRLKEAKHKHFDQTGQSYRGRLAMMRHTAVYDNETDRQTTLNSVRKQLGQFGNLMLKKGDVINGFAEVVSLADLEGNVFVDESRLEQNLAFGSPSEVINKLNQYQSLGVDAFIYYASMGLGLAEQKRSLQLFIDKVMPNFAE